MTKHGIILSDLHCGHMVGLTPPIYQLSPPTDAPHQVIKQNEQRKVLWNWFSSEVNKCGKFGWALVNGDAIEGKNEKAEGVELIASSRDQQKQMAIECLRFVNAKKYDFTYGTPYHVGQGEDWEKQIAEHFGAEIQNEGHFDINGFIVAAKHFIGNSSSPVSKFTAAARVAIIQSMWAEMEQQPRANLIVRSHIHRCYSVFEPEYNRAVWTTPGLQGLGSRIVRKMDGLPVNFGFLELFVKSKTEWGVTAHIAPLKLQAARVIKI